MRKTTRWSTITAFVLFVTGCGTVPSDLPDGVGRKTLDEAVSDWGATPALVTEVVGDRQTIKRPGVLPRQYREQYVEVSLQAGSTLNDLVHTLSLLGIPTLLSDPEVADKALWVPHYAGPLGGLLDAASATLGVSFNWQNGILIIEGATRFMMRVPQDKTVIEAVKEELSSLGAEEIVASKSSGIMSFKVSKASEDVVLDYMQRITENAATINLQVAVVNVSLSRDKKSGFDWSSMSAVFGDTEVFSNNDAGSDEPSASVALKATSGGFELALTRPNFSLNGFVSMLSTYGSARTAQNLIMKTLSGATVKLRSGSTVPFVSGISSTANENSVSSGTETDEAESGLTVEMTPSFDADTGVVTLDLTLDLKSIISFVELSAGNSLGTITQPNVQEQSFNNTARVKAGETIIIGGITFDLYNDNRNTIGALEQYPIAHKSQKRQREALFIAIRPTVRMYEFRNQ